MPTHEFEGRGAWKSEVSFKLSCILFGNTPSVLIEYNWLTPDRASINEIANPENVIDQIRERDARARFLHLVISLP